MRQLVKSLVPTASARRSAVASLVPCAMSGAPCTKRRPRSAMRNHELSQRSNHACPVTCQRATRRVRSPTVAAAFSALTQLPTAPVAKVDQKHDEILEAQLTKIINKAGGIAKESAKAPYMPRRVAGIVDDIMSKIWDEVGMDLKTGIMASYGRANKAHAASAASRRVCQHLTGPGPPPGAPRAAAQAVG